MTMCGTCGCNSNKSITLLKPEDMDIQSNHPHLHSHNHPHSHPHSHSHEHHHHHPGHSTQVLQVDLEKEVLHRNQLLAERNRGFFAAKNIFVFNIVSSPGSGKTTLLEKTLRRLNPEFKCSVIEGDQHTTQDAQRIQATKTPVVQINTGKGCHLESDNIAQAVKELDPAENSYLFIENVGNLVCPSMFDLGENVRVVLFSVTEGADKPLKYPDAFHEADVCIINKVDLLPYVEFDLDQAKSYARRINHHLTFFETSATRETGLDDWIQWIKQQKLQ